MTKDKGKVIEEGVVYLSIKLERYRLSLGNGELDGFFEGEEGLLHG